MVRRHRRCEGFTLLEVLVALSILAIGLGAAIRAVSATTDTVAALHDRRLASWVAQNQLALLHATRHWPSAGETDGETTMDGSRFAWRMRVEAFGQSRFRRVDLTVFQAGVGGKTERLAHLVGFLAPP
jgi:general secretion pathway protein I